MPCNRYLSNDVKELVVKELPKGTSTRNIAAVFDVNQSTVSRIGTKHRNTKSVDNLPRGGRPRKSNERNDHILVRIVKREPRKTATNVAKYANEHLKLGITSRTARK